MAIKGKSKPKGGSKAPARGPKPAYVPVHRPLLQRRAFWVTVLAVLGLAAIVGLWYGIARQRSADREEALANDLADAAAAYQQQVEPSLATVGQPVPPSGFEVLPGFSAALEGFIGGTTDADQLEAEASRAADQAGQAAKQLEGIDAVGLVAGKGFDEPTALYVVNSQSRLTQGLQLYARAAELALDASGAPTKQAKGFAEQAAAVIEVAKSIVDDGYQDYLEFQIRAGTFQPQVPAP